MILHFSWGQLYSIYIYITYTIYQEDHDPDNIIYQEDHDPDNIIYQEDHDPDNIIYQEDHDPDKHEWIA